MPPSQDSDLELELEFYRREQVDREYPDAWGELHYLIRWGRGDAGESALEWSESFREALVALQAPEVDQERVQVIAERLRAFLEPAGWAKTERAIAKAVADQRQVRISIASQAAEIYALPWELLAVGTGERLSELPRVLIRYVWPKVSAAPAKANLDDWRQGPVLFAWSAAGGRVPKRQHRKALREAYGAEGVLELEAVTRDSLAAALRERAESGQPVRILHLLCHGSLAGAAPALLLDSGGADPDFIDPNALRGLLGPFAATLRLVVLCACQGGQAVAPDSRLGSMALALHRGTTEQGGGVEAVVASRLLFPIPASIAFAKTFFTTLRREGLARAFVAGRDAMRPERSGTGSSLAHASIQLFGADPGSAAPVEVARPVVHRERRWVTLVAVRLAILDIDDRSELPADEAAEYLAEVGPEFIKLCREEGELFGGHLHTIGGDCYISYGYRKIVERNVPRAVRAALAIREAIEELSPRYESEDIAVAVHAAVHSGDMYVVPGEDDDTQEFARGDVTTIARALTTADEPGTVVVSAQVQVSVEGFFEFEALGARAAGRQQLQVYRVVGDTSIEDPFEARRRRGLSPLVGRDPEVARFDRWWSEAKTGAGQLVLISAPAGVGKSRLLQEFKDRLADEDVELIELQCSPHHTDSALYPVIRAFERVLGFVHGEPDDARLDKIERLLTASDPEAVEYAPLVAELLSVPYTARYGSLESSASERRQDTLELLVWLIVELSKLHLPRLLIAEDLHWVDPSTQEFLDMLAKELTDSRVLALFSYRPHYDPPWDNIASDVLNLARLERAQVEQIINYVTQGRPMPELVVDEIVRKAEGIPLFAEESARMVIASGLVRLEGERYVLAKPASSIELGIPAELKDTVMARIDSLATSKPVAQLGATIGRDFSHKLIQAIWDGDDAGLKKNLKKLVSVELLQRKGLLTRANYRFKHALQRDALYDSLGNRDRKQHHLRISKLLETDRQFQSIAETQPELLAYHYSHAGRETRVKAIEYYLKASEQCNRKYANLEATHHAYKALELLPKVKAGKHRDELELDLQRALIPPLLAIKGWASAELGAAYMRSKELVSTDALADSPDRFPVMRGVWSYNMVGAKLLPARELAEELVDIAEARDSDDYRIEAFAAVGDTLFWLGEPEEALEAMESALDLYDVGTHHEPHVQDYGEDPGAIALCYATLCKWLLGEAEEAEELAATALEWFDQFSQPFSRAFLLFGVAWHYVQVGDHAQVEVVTQRLIALSREHKFATWLGAALAMQGWARAAAGHLDEGIDMMIEGRRQWHATGVGVKSVLYPALIAEALLRAGRHDEALEWIETGLRDGETHAEGHWRSELYRLRAEVRAVKGAGEDAIEADYREALAIAHAQEAEPLIARVEASRARHRGA